MGVYVVKKGLDLPIEGIPEQQITSAPTCQNVAVLAQDYVGMRPTFHVKEGDCVQRGQLLFEDKKIPGVRFTAPGAGVVTAINRGARRAFQSVVIALSDAEKTADAQPEQVTFEAYTGKDLALLTRDEVEGLLVESGMWTAFRTRPYSKTPAPGTKPAAIFVTASDTQPLAPSMDTVAAGRAEDLDAGLLAVAKLTDGPAYFCKSEGMALSPSTDSGILIKTFAGPHPSGLVGTHIHMLEPVSRNKTVWHIGLQDVLAIGALFRTGKLDVQRVVALAGPGVTQPRLLRTRLGASLADLTQDNLSPEEELRILSGSVLAGRTAQGEVLGYLGRYHQQVCVLKEGREREFLGWMAPGAEKFSITNLFTSRMKKGKRFSFTTTTHGSPRAMVPIGLYEKVMPLDILPTFLLRSLVVGDIERAEALGCLELDEEDLALCTFVCPGKTEYGALLRENLTTIEKEG